MNDFHSRGLAGAVLLLCSCAAPGGVTVDEDSVELAVFADPDSDFSTSDVRDVNGELVRFDTQTDQLIWVAEELAFDGWGVNGNRLGTGFFTVLFGSEGGERRAYFTETITRTICDISVSSGRLRVQATSTPVPQD